MKSALVYLLLTRLKAQFKEMVRKPARLIYLVLVIALFAVTLLAETRQRAHRATRGSFRRWPGRFTG